MELTLYLKEQDQFRSLKVPLYVIKDLLRDRLSQSELSRVDRLAEKTQIPEAFKAGSVVVDFSTKTAFCYQAGLNLDYLEPTWKVQIKDMNLLNY